MNDPMTSDIRVIDVQRADDWPSGTQPGTREYLTALAGNGPVRLAANAKGVTGEVLRVGETVLPLLISDGALGKASILSPRAHHIGYPIFEIARQSRYLNEFAVASILSPLTLLMKLGALDRVVLINHWLLSGSPEPNVGDQDWPRIFAYVADRFPGHALVVPDIKPDRQPQRAKAMEIAGAFPVPTRIVNLVDPAKAVEGKRFKKMRYKRKQGEKNLRAAESDRITGTEARDQCKRLARLYRQSNRNNHSTLNPDYTEAFFALALTSEAFALHAWREAGADDTEIAGFNLQRMDEETIHWSTFGVDPAAKDAEYLYERIAAADLDIALRKQLWLDWGAGADGYKRHRGAEPYSQVEMVVTRHLPMHQRMAWNLLSRLRHLRQRQMLAQIEASRE